MSTIPLPDLRSKSALENPRNLCEDDLGLFADAFSSEVHPFAMQCLEGVEAFGRGPLRHRGEYLPVSFCSHGEYQNWFRRRGHWRAALEQRIQSEEILNEPVIWITDNWSFGYFHWLSDALPRLQAASQEIDLSEVTLILPYKSKRFSFIRKSLEAFNLRSIRVMRRFERLVCQKMWIPSHVAPSGNFNRCIFESLQSRLLEEHRMFSPASNENIDRIYISRRKAAHRRIENESEILPVLRRHDIRCVVAEDFGFEQQVEMAMHAKLLVSSHGSGLTNMMFMAPGQSVLEIRDSRGPTPNCFVKLATAANLDFYYLCAERTNPNLSAHFANIVVDPDKLDELLHKMTSN